MTDLSLPQTEEIWKAIKDYEGLYEVSTLGRVRSLDRFVSRICNGETVQVCRKGKILHPQYNTWGYVHVRLAKDGINTMKTVHRLVAEAFIPNPENKLQINHKNGKKDQNLVDNLEWNTRSENQRHRFVVLGHKGIPRNEKPVIGYNDNGEIYFPSIHAAKRAGYRPDKCLSGYRPTSFGYKWRYA